MARWKNPAIVLGLAFAVIGVLAWFARPLPADVDVASVIRGPLKESVDDDGRTRIKDRYVVSAPLAGRLPRMGLRAGDSVLAGDTLLAVIEPKDPDLLDAAARGQAEARVKSATAARQQSAAQVAKARADAEFASRELERVEAADKKGGVTATELDGARARAAAATELVRSAEFAELVAKFELEQAVAALARTRPRSAGETDDSRFEIRSPIDGKVLRVFQESATIVSPGTQLLELGNTADLEIVIDVLSTDAVRIATGQKVLLEHWGGPEPLQGRVRLVEPSAFTKISALGVEEQRVNIVVDFEGTREKYSRLGDGFRVEARVIVWEADNVLKVPAGALFRQGDRWAVFIVANNRAEIRLVSIGHSDGSETEILDGLNESDSVILHPSDKVRAGVRVRPR